MQIKQFLLTLRSQILSLSMKTIFFISLILILTFGAYHQKSLKLKVGTRFKVRQASSYELQCEGAEGQVKYEAKGLPRGVKLEENRIELEETATPGNYIVKISAEDELGNTVSKVLTLVVVKRAEEEKKAEAAAKAEKKSRLVDILNAYSTPVTFERKKYMEDRFPEINFPDNKNDDAINTIPKKIESVISRTSNKNRNIITAQNVHLKAASERHQNAVKGITNLIAIVDQARADRLNAQNEVEKFIKVYNDALADQRKIQTEIVALETRVMQIESAIAGIDEEIDNLVKKIDDLEAKKAGYEEEKAILLEQIAAAEKTKAELLAEIQKINEQLAELMKELAINKEKCQDLAGEVEAKANEKKEAEDFLAQIIEMKAAVEEKIKERTSIVADLQKQLVAAEEALTDAKIELADLEEQEKALPIKIAQLGEELAELEKLLEECEAETARIQAIIDETMTDDLMKKVDELEDEILGFRKRVVSLDGQIAATLKPIADAKAKLKAARDDLGYLRKQIGAAEEQLRQAYVKGNDANTAVAHARENVEANNARFEKESKRISEGTLNLERARAEEALARLALDEMIAKFTNALPYAVIPHGNEQTEKGDPAGNNPSGSPLGAIKLDGDGAPGEFEITNFASYLSQAFGAGVHPSFPGSVTKLFPFHALSEVDGSWVNNKFSLREEEEEICEEEEEDDIVASGEVIWVGENSFKVLLNNGEVYDIEIDPCTKMNSNKKQYKMEKGDEAVFKGNKRNDDKILAKRLTCLK